MRAVGIEIAIAIVIAIVAGCWRRMVRRVVLGVAGWLVGLGRPLSETVGEFADGSDYWVVFGRIWFGWCSQVA